MIKLIIIYTTSLMLVGIQQARSDSIALFFALDQDLAALRSSGSDAVPLLHVGGTQIARLSVGPHVVYATQMGSGCVDAALAAEALLARFRCDRAVSIGPAGDLTGRLDIGAWYPVGRILAWQRLGDEGGDVRGAQWDAEAGPFPGVPAGSVQQATSAVALISGEAFIASAAERDELATRWQAELVDMNAFGVAAACRHHDVPLRVWRVVSDHADEDAQRSFREFVTAYDGAGGRAVAEWIRGLPPNPEAASSYEGLRALMGGGR